MRLRGMLNFLSALPTISSDRPFEYVSACCRRKFGWLGVGEGRAHGVPGVDADFVGVFEER